MRWSLSRSRDFETLGSRPADAETRRADSLRGYPIDRLRMLDRQRVAAAILSALAFVAAHRRGCRRG